MRTPSHPSPTLRRLTPGTSGAAPVAPDALVALIAAVAAVVWLLLDLLRAWTPLLITVFGRAAETPPELIGAFALGVTALPLLVLVVAGRALTRRALALQLLLGVALVARVAVAVTAGRPLLVAASVGVAAALLGLALVAGRAGPAFVPGLLAGVAVATVTHAALGTWAAVWRHDVAGTVATATLAVATLLAGRTLPEHAVAAPRRVGWLTLPVLLVCGIALANPARSLVAHPLGTIVTSASTVAAALLVQHRWSRRARRIAAVGVVAASAVVLLPDPLPAWSLVGFALGMPCLAITASGTSRGRGHPPVATARAVASGAVLFTVLLFAVYAGYDLGYRADWLPVLAAATVVGILVLRVPVDEAPPSVASDVVRRNPLAWRRPVPVVVVAAAALLAWVGPPLTLVPIPRPERAETALGVAAFNVRMGYGIDGTFRPRETAELLRREHADVVLLSEVDRGWLLNGGQDQLTVVARLLDMEVAFGPAADQVWGDAVLSRYPVDDVHTERLPAYDSLTGAQVLAATVDGPFGPVRVVSTHLQPDADRAEPSLRQARDIRAFVAREQAEHPMLVLGGDFNLEPGGREFDALVRDQDGQPGLIDALQSARPLLTSSSDDPHSEIDHILVTPGLHATHPRAVPSLLSDHLPVVVDLTRR